MYWQPTELETALTLLGSERCAVVAGGTDYYPSRVGSPGIEPILDISRVAGLRGISRVEGRWRIGALTTWSEVLRAGLPAAMAAIGQAARQVGGLQVQNRGTVGGNLCNASAAADGVPALLVFDAEVELAGPAGLRRMPLEAFMLGSRRTARAPDELLTAVFVRDPAPGVRSVFLKLGHRSYLVISIVMVAVAIEIDEAGTIRSARVAVGSCSAAARRLPGIESALSGCRADLAAESIARLLASQGRDALAPLAPIDDARGTADYRFDAAGTLVVRALRSVAESGR